LKQTFSKPLRPLTTHLPRIVKLLLKDEAIGGKLIAVAALAALLIANTPLQQMYGDFWHQRFTVFGISLDLREWVNEGLMALFFLTVGLEIKREIIKGQLRHIKAAALPIGAAIGGMIVPAVIFLIFNAGQPATMHGWAIPIATDIAFALAVMSLLGNRVPSSLKIFLLTLAIVDDLGSILIIALFYGDGFNLWPLIVAAGLAIAMIIGRKLLTLPLFILCGLVFWAAIYKAGIHASIAGAILGFLAPLDAHRSETSIAEKLERLAIPPSTLIVVPLFAFANLGIAITAASWSSPGAGALAAGIIFGLIVGKVVGVVTASWLLTKLRLAVLPAGVYWMQLIGVGLLAGIGFTVSVFITELAFPASEELTNAAKLAIIIASTISAALGYLFLRYRRRIQNTF
jgi:Na+:H+ antiporter, NhaA family